MNRDMIWRQELTCKPLDNYNEVIHFLQHPPPWRSLCRPITPHSKNVIRNMDIHGHYGITELESPESYCHFNPDMDEVQRSDGKNLPKTLVCHDLANGYHDDSVIDGTENADAYTFYNWAGIDIFCYFSHHFITIPPLGWINVGHDHGVKVIGTVITEWAEGVAMWDRILESSEEYENFASALVAIAQTLKFDGWLLNIENKVSKPEALLRFVKYLHSMLHAELVDPVLVWYDSVTVDGKLNWQNGLNDKNKAFFDVCDAFFTNYSWTEADVAASARAAGGRLPDLFVGIDVWGRNFYGGGQFNVQEAVKVAFSYGCSLAIFAPAWTHEAMDQSREESAVALAGGLRAWEVFLLRDRALWGSLWPFLNTRLPERLPFHTSFCRGRGRKRRLYGEVLCPGPWYNLRHMQYQPNSAHGPHGYMLSTYELIRGVSRVAFFKDAGGILRYHKSFLRARADLVSTPSELRLAPRADSLPLAAPRRHTMLRSVRTAFKHILFQFKKKEEERSDSPPATSLTPAREHVEGESDPVAVPTAGIPEAIVDDPEASTEDREAGTEEASAASEPVAAETAEAAEAASSGRSMLQVPIRLRLGPHAAKTRYALARVPGELECLEQFEADSFSGGACLRVQPSDRVAREHRHVRLLHCDFPAHLTLIACVVTKNLPGYEDQSLNVKLLTRGGEGGEATWVLVGRDAAGAGGAGGGGVAGSGGVAGGRGRCLYPLEAAGAHFAQLRKYLLLNEPAFYVPVQNHFGWHVRYYVVRAGGGRITSVVCRTANSEGPILLGHFGLCHVRTDDTVIK